MVRFCGVYEFNYNVGEFITEVLQKALKFNQFFHSQNLGESEFQYVANYFEAYCQKKLEIKNMSPNEEIVNLRKRKRNKIIVIFINF